MDDSEQPEHVSAGSVRGNFHMESTAWLHMAVPLQIAARAAQVNAALDYGIVSIYSNTMSSGHGGPVKDRPTIGMVAEQAGVATSTVSRVLNGGYASEEVRERVERA